MRYIHRYYVVSITSTSVDGIIVGSNTSKQLHALLDSIIVN